MPKDKFDPLESAKVEKSSWWKKDKKKGGEQAEPPKEEKEAAGEIAKAEPTPEAPAPAPSTPSSRRKRYKVKVGKTVSIDGCMTHIPTGEVLDEAGYGPEGIERIRKQGVELEEVKE